MEHISVERTPRRTPRKVSENVRELHSALAKVLHNEDRAFLIQSLNQYQRDRDVNSLVVALKSVLNTPRKREVYPLLWQIIPHSDQDIFHNLWHRDAEASRQRNLKSPARSPGNLRRVPASSSFPDNLHRHASDSGIDLPNMTQFQSSKETKYAIKRLTVKRPSNSGFGFSIRGGAEHGVGLYVSSVDENSVAEKEGVLPGDHVIQVNGTRFDGLTHEQAVKIIQHSKKLYLIVRSVGRIPNSFVAESTCKWADIRGRRVSPPPGFDESGHKLTAESIHKSDLRLLGDDDERKVNIFVEDGEKLGLMIRGGAEYGLGIFIAGVDRDCAAEYAGLKAGDQILDVNGQSFLNITHKQAVKVLKSTKNMIVTLKDIGRLPFTRVTHDKTKWITRSAKNGQIQHVPEGTHITEVEVHAPSARSTHQGHPPLSYSRHTTAGRMGFERDGEISMFHHGIVGSQVLYNGGFPTQKHLITEQARQILNENELGTLGYYLEEYSQGYITVNAFALALFDLLNTPAKMSLIQEIRSSVAPRDIDKFDDLVLKKEVEIMKSRQFFGDYLDDDRHSVHSFVSSVSSFSGKGSSSRSSLKGSLDGSGSRPITPPQVPEVLPPNVKVENDMKGDSMKSYEVYEATLTFNDENEEVSEDDENMGLPSFLTINSESLDLPEEETTLVSSSLGSSASLSTSSPLNEQNGHVSPIRTVGEVTTSVAVGGNSRNGTQANSVSLTSGFGIHSDGSQVEGHRETRGEVSSTGPPTSPERDKSSPVHSHQKKDTENPQSPPNPFIFPSTFQGSIKDTESFESVSAVFETFAVKHNNSAGSSPQEHFIAQDEANDDLRPEVAKLPGRKRVASWGEVQDETTLENEGTSSISENTILVNGDRQPPVRSRPYNGLETSEQGHCVTDNQRNNLGTSDTGDSVVQNRNYLRVSSDPQRGSQGQRGGSAANNRKSWDGVRHHGETGENQKVSQLHKPKDNKERSCSDSNLMNLPKKQQKEIQAKHRASQELLELHQQSKTKVPSSHQVVSQKTDPVTRGGMQSPRRVNGVSESAFLVEVNKSSSSLGLTLEGGSDVGSDVKIKSLKEGNFAAWKCGRLKAGQVLLQVDNTPLRGMTSGIAVLTLRHAYSNSDSDVLKLLVRDVS